MAAGTEYGFRRRMAAALLALVGFATFCFGAVDPAAWAAIVVATFALLAIWAVRKLWRPSRTVWTWLVGPLLLLAATGALQLLTGGTEIPYATSGELLRWLAYAAFFLLAVNALEDASIRLWYLGGFLVVVCAAGLIGVVQGLTIPHLVYWSRAAPGAQPFGPFADVEQLAVLIELAFPVALTLALRRSNHKIHYFAACGALVIAVAGSGSRTALAIVAAQLVFVALLFAAGSTRSALASRRRGPHALENLLGGGALAVLLLLAAATMGALRIGSEAAPAVANQALSPKQVRLAAWELVEQQPWLGHGLGAFSQAFRRVKPLDDGLEWKRAQCDPLELIVEAGLPGLLAQLSLFGLALWRARNRTAWGGVIAPLAGAWTHSWFAFPLSAPAVTLSALALLACLPGVTARVEVRGSASSSEAAPGKKSTLAGGSPAAVATPVAGRPR